MTCSVPRWLWTGLTCWNTNTGWSWIGSTPSASQETFKFRLWASSLRTLSVFFVSFLSSGNKRKLVSGRLFACRAPLLPLTVGAGRTHWWGESLMVLHTSGECNLWFFVCSSSRPLCLHQVTWWVSVWPVIGGAASVVTDSLCCSFLKLQMPQTVTKWIHKKEKEAWSRLPVVIRMLHPHQHLSKYGLFGELGCLRTCQFLKRPQESGYENWLPSLKIWFHMFLAYFFQAFLVIVLYLAGWWTKLSVKFKFVQSSFSVCCGSGWSDLQAVPFRFCF